MQQGAAAIIKNYNGAFLLHLRDEKAPLMKNEWCIVGGSIEGDETPEEAVRREISEETGLTVENLVFYKTIIKKDSGRKVSIFTATTDTRYQEVVLGEGKELRFFSKEDALKLLTSIQNKNQYLQVFEEFLKANEATS